VPYILQTIDYNHLVLEIKSWAKLLGFTQVGITDLNLSLYQQRFNHWLKQRRHGEMAFMERYVEARLHPEQLVDKTARIICVAMPYGVFSTESHVPIARYALGGDYHRFIRKRLQQLAHKINEAIGEFSYRAFSDSAPVFEKALAEKAGIGWTGKHTCLIHESLGSAFFLGELFTDLPLPIDQPIRARCGDCQHCLHVCPTGALTAPYQLNAERCIGYLTIEYKGVIPESLRPLIGRRIFGCDECLRHCVWSPKVVECDPFFKPREVFDRVDLLALFDWREETFLAHTEGSVIRRVGYECWQRNIAIALGNSPKNERILAALHKKMETTTKLVKEHIIWAIRQQSAVERNAEKLFDYL